VCAATCSPFHGGAICRFEKIDERYFALWADSALAAVSLSAADTRMSYIHPAPSELRFETPFASAEGAGNKCLFLRARLKTSGNGGSEIAFGLHAPRPNVAFVRAFALQMLRGLGYCHSRKRTFHEDVKCENIFHRNRITADHLLCHRDAMRVMKEMKVEIGDFGKAVQAHFSSSDFQTSDFKRLAWVLLCTVDAPVFTPLFKRFPFCKFPSKETTRGSCSHFDTDDHNAESFDQFFDLVSVLQRYPAAASSQPEPAPLSARKSAFEFAEHLARTHAFFQPLRTKKQSSRSDCAGSQRSRSPSPQPAQLCPVNDALKSLDDENGGHHPAPQSAFQHLLEYLSLESGSIAGKLEDLLDVIQNSSLKELTQHTRYGLFQKLWPLLQMRAPELDQSCFFAVVQIIFQVLDLCCDKRHVLMQVSFGRECSFLQFLSKCAVGDAATLQRLPACEAPSVRVKSRCHVLNIVRKSIPYASLNDWAQCISCYSDEKMRSMLTHNVVDSIFGALFPSESQRAQDGNKFYFSDATLTPSMGQLCAFFDYWRIVLTTADAVNAASVSLCQEICSHPTVQELQRNLHHE
jgi:hypothetical protein